MEKNKLMSQAVTYTVILASKRLRQQDCCRFMSNLGYIQRLYSKSKKNNQLTMPDKSDNTQQRQKKTEAG